MQYSDITLVKKFERLPLGFIVKTISLLLILSYLGYVIKKEQRLLEKLFYTLKEVWLTEQYILFLVPILLMPCNWAAEALKWKILSKKVVRQNFTQSIVGVLSGLTLGFITPQSLGEYAGRIWQIKSSRRSELVGAVFIGSIIQCIISLLFGLGGVLVFVNNHNVQISQNSLILFVALLAVILISLRYFWKSSIIPNVAKNFYQKYFSIITTYSSKELIQVGWLSFLRYVIFSSQFIIVLILFKVDLPIPILFAGVSWVFVAKSIIPAFNFLSDIGVREFSALLFFAPYNIDISKIILASLLIWAINILLPTIAGSLLVYKMRVLK
ncbi:MAG: flippase-like domain-containing protein [Bacteroidota bacterium]|nr:flippase-like domain-containing protein [Bacteroidota bacterium]